MPSEASPLRTTLIRALELAHQGLEGTVADVDDELANRQPSGRANSVGSCYMHVLLSEDAIVNQMLGGGSQLSETTWAGRTGADRPQAWDSEEALGKWYHSVRVDMEAAKRFAQEVYARSAQFVDSLDDAKLTSEVELFGMRVTVAVAVESFVTGHANNLAGEISAIKGTFGRKGYQY